MTESKENLSNEILTPEAKIQQKLAISVAKLRRLREFTESSVDSKGSLAAEEVIVKNIPIIGFITDGDLKGTANGRSKSDNLSLRAKITELPLDLVRDTQDRIEQLFKTVLAIQTFQTAVRLRAFLPVVMPETRAGFTILHLIAQKLDETSNLSEVNGVLRQLDGRVKAVGLSDQMLTEELTGQVQEGARERLAKLKAEDPAQVDKIKSIIAEQKMAKLRRQEVEDDKGNSVFEVLVKEIIEKDGLEDLVEMAREKRVGQFERAKEEAITDIVRQRAIGTVASLIDSNPLFCQILAGRQRMSVDEFLRAPDSVKRQAANNALNSKNLVLSAEQRKVFRGDQLIQEERKRLEQDLQDPLLFIATLSDNELRVIRDRVHKPSDRRSVFSLASDRLRKRLEDEITEDQMISYLAEMIKGELLTRRSPKAVDATIKDLGISSGFVLEDPGMLSKFSEDIVVKAQRYLFEDQEDKVPEVVQPPRIEKKRDKLFRNLQVEVVSPDVSDPMVVGKSEVAIIDPESKGAQRVSGILRGLIALGVLDRSLAENNHGIMGTGDAPAAIMHKANTTIYVDVETKNRRKLFVHVRNLAQDTKGRYGWINDFMINEGSKLAVFSGLCLFSSAGVSAVSEDGSVSPLTNPYVNEDISSKIVDLNIDKRLQPYEVDSILRLSEILSNFNSERVDMVNLAIPRFEYWIYALSAYEKGLIDNFLLLSWFDSTEQRALGVAKLMSRRIDRGLRVNLVEPLAPIGDFLKDSVRSNQKGLLPRVIDILHSSDQMWRVVLEGEQKDGSLSNFAELGYLSYVVGYLKALEKSGKSLVVVENPEEAGILNRTRSLIGKIMDQASIVGLYIHPNVVLNEDPEVAGGRTLYFFDPKDSYKKAVTEIVRANR